MSEEKKAQVKLDFRQLRRSIYIPLKKWVKQRFSIPMKQSLVQDALKVVHSPQVLVNIVSKRVRQLGQGFRPLVAFDPKLTFMDVALKEVAEGKLGFEMIEVPSAAGYHTPVAPVKKSRKAAAAA